VLLEASVNMKSERYGENVRGKGRMGNSTYMAINKVRTRARYKQASMVLCKPGLQLPPFEPLFPQVLLVSHPYLYLSSLPTIGARVFVEGWVVTFVVIGPCSIHRLMYTQ
jgi:hypothetical protein